MKTKNLGILVSLLIGQMASATTITVIDSGTDLKHEEIVNSVWVNPVDNTSNEIDEDNNGYADDINGWNFAEKNNEVIDYQYLGRLTADIRRFFETQTRFLRGNAQQSDIDWMNSKRNDEEFIKDLQVYGNFMHGTHVSGITIKDNSTEINLMAIKLLPTEVKQVVKENSHLKGTTNFLLKIMLKRLADAQMKSLEEVGKYIGSHESEIANGSFGIGVTQAKAIVAQIAKLVLGRDATEAELEENAKFFLEEVVEGSSKMVDASPKTLFVFAAGNDGTNNDEYPAAPASVKRDNVISVAATLDHDSLAPFSCYGAQAVHIAAPGVGIKSSVPGDKYLEVSGTSQASPYVANVAAAVKHANKDLQPIQIKKILMGTVDKKQFLAGKVVSGGIVNKERAIIAANLTKNQELNASIRAAFERVPARLDLSFTLKSNVFDINGIVSPLGSMFDIN